MQTNGVIICPQRNLTANATAGRVNKVMKPNNKLRLRAALCIAMTLSPVVALAQTSPTATPKTTVTTSTDREEHHDYGWIGLLGLIGLAGLIRRRPDVYTHDTAAGRTDVRR